MRHETHYVLPAAAAVCLLVVSQFAAATGFFIPQQSVQTFGRATAGSAAAASDISTVFYNPAGLAVLAADTKRTWRGGAATGLNLIAPRVSVSDRGTTVATPGTGAIATAAIGSNGGNPGQPTPVPHGYGATVLGDGKFVIGVGLTAPFGLTNEYHQGWFGRYDSVKSELKTINITPSFATALNDWLFVGGGLDIQYAEATLTKALPNTLNPGGPTVATDGMSELEGDDISVGYNAGVLIWSRPWRVGLHYRSHMKHTLTGNARISGLGGPLAGLNSIRAASVDLDLPDILSVGAAWERDRLTLYGGAMHFGWSSFDEIRIKFNNGSPDSVQPQGYRDTWNAAVGAEYRLKDWQLRGGVQFSRTPTVDAFRGTTLPDANSWLIATGASWAPAALKSLQFDAALGASFYRTATLNHSFALLGPPVAGTQALRATADTTVYTAAISLRYLF